jgi:hypothetical protein
VEDQLDRDRIEGERLLSRFGRLDPYWGPQLVVLAAILLDLTLSDHVSLVHPKWVVPSLEALVLVALVIATPYRRVRISPIRRRFALGVIGIVSLTNSISLVLLCHQLLRGTASTAAGGRALLLSGIVLWVTNVLLFGVWYWELDRGGPIARSRGEPDLPDFLFVQMTVPDQAPADWEPRLIDYVYTSFTNATAFSPTDTMPLTAMAKSLMTVQSLTALVTIGLVVARAVNII